LGTCPYYFRWNNHRTEINGDLFSLDYSKVF